MTKIDVEDAKPGVIVMNGLIGNCAEMFEIRIHEGSYHYWVREIEVPPEVYRDAFELATRDRYIPGSQQEDNGEEPVAAEPD